MSDGEVLSEAIVMRGYDGMADLGVRNDEEDGRQEMMVANNEKASLVLNYNFLAPERRRVLEAAKPSARYGPLSARAGSTPRQRSEPDASLPEIGYRSPYFDQFKPSVDDAIVILMTEHTIPESLEPEFKSTVLSCARNFKLEASRSSLPDGPKRDYVSGEGILNYLRSADGFAPWIAAGPGALTRPLIREKAPKAYTALANWLRSNDLPDDLPIPTKSEALDAAQSAPISVREARRIARRADRRPDSA